MSLLRVAENLEKDTESENVSDKNQESSGNEKGANEFATVPKENALSVPPKIEDDLARPQDLNVKRIGSLQEEEEKKFPKQDF